jgi:hypothetical protein
VFSTRIVTAPAWHDHALYATFAESVVEVHS